MKLTKVSLYHYLFILLLQMISFSRQITVEENGKDLPSNYNYDLLARRRRPSSGAGGAGCNFNGIRGKPKTDATGRTFFDLQFINVGYNYNYDIHCGGGGAHPPGGGGTTNPILGGGGGGGGINKPFLHKPHQKPILGGLFQQGGGDHQEGGTSGNRPLLSALFGNRPFQGIFSQSQSQSQTGAISGAVSEITNLLPKPQDIGQGLGEGISSFVSTLPQIGQSFQSLLPSFENFQLPSLPSLSSLFQGGQGATPTQLPGAGVTPVGPDPTDPDEMIYNDSVKPVHEDHDPVTDPHLTNKLPPGVYYNRNDAQIKYQQNQNYQNQKLSMYGNRKRYHYQQNGHPYGQNNGFREPYRQYEGRSVYDGNDRDRGGRTFRFPS